MGKPEIRWATCPGCGGSGRERTCGHGEKRSHTAAEDEHGYPAGTVHKGSRRLRSALGAQSARTYNCAGPGPCPVCAPFGGKGKIQKFR